MYYENIINISKTFFITEEVDTDSLESYFCVYAREEEPEPHNSFCASFNCYYDACEYAIEEATELGEEVEDDEPDSK